MNPEILKGFAVSAVVSAAVSFGMLHLAVAPQARASVADSPLVAPAAAAPSPARRDTPAAQDDAIHEAHSDGGYWDWMEQQRAMP
ncbi:MAG TPA: hypothetical protein VFK92_18360 [Burkholderiales bacterium]|nr:hypothetical protein [Burkholderiales bacterium]